MNQLGAMAAFGSSLTWAVGVTFYAKLSKRYSPATINLTRASIAVSFFVVCLLIRSVSAQLVLPTTADALWLLFSMLSSYVLADVIFITSTQKIGVPSALAIASSYPIWSALEGAVFKGEHLNFLQWISLLTIVGGVVLVIRVGTSTGPLEDRAINQHYKMGVILALITSVLWSCNTYAISKVSHSLSLEMMSTIRMGIAVLLCPIVGKLNPVQKFQWRLDFADLKKYFPVFAFESICGTVFFAYGLTHTSLGIASALSSLAPVISAPIAWILKTEPVALVKLTGIMLVFIGILGLIS